MKSAKSKFDAGRARVMTAALRVALFAVALNVMCGPAILLAQNYNALKTVRPNDTSLPVALRGVGIEQRLGEQLPLDAPFRDEIGREVTLGTYFNKQRPIVLAFVYYSCPMMCNQILYGLAGSLKAVPFEVGKDFDVVAVSFDPREDRERSLAAERKRTLLASFGLAATAPGWHFLTGGEESIARATQSAGFSYRWDAATEQFAHASGIMIATPGGQLSRYFYGIEYAPREIKFGLIESAENRIGSVADAVVLYCYHYDPATGQYSAVLRNILRAAAAGFLVLAAIGYLALWLSRRRGRRLTMGEAKGAA